MLENIVVGFFSWLIAIMIISIPIMWIWIFYHKIKCRKVEGCTNKKCRYWNWCDHNEAERRKEEIEIRIMMLEAQRGQPKDDDKKTK